ncbi:MAG: hypothetical protein ACTSQP_19690 [Promethearchaeota archaeon]
MNANIETNNNKYKILIIGANGFLGRNLIECYKIFKNIREEYNIIAASLNKKIFSHNIPFYNLDITIQKEVNN